MCVRVCVCVCTYTCVCVCARIHVYVCVYEHSLCVYIICTYYYDIPMHIYTPTKYILHGQSDIKNEVYVCVCLCVYVCVYRISSIKRPGVYLLPEFADPALIQDRRYGTGVYKHNDVIRAVYIDGTGQHTCK